MAFESSITCIVRGCTSSGKALRAWLGRVCFEHQPSSKAECSCPPLYDFHQLPIDVVQRRLWLKAMHLAEAPQKSYVCSIHFANKKPTDAHPYPELYLGVKATNAGEAPSLKARAKASAGSKKKTGLHIGNVKRAMGTPTSASNEGDMAVEHKCELCGTCFETRRGLSSHARCHLRQLGVSVSDSSGAPIELLYRLIEERDGQLPKPPPVSKHSKHKGLHHLGIKRNGQAQGPALKLKISNQLRKKYNIFSQASMARKNSAAATTASVASVSASSQLSLSPVPDASPSVVKKIAVSGSSPFSLSPVVIKEQRPSRERGPAAAPPGSSAPHWAPQDTDAPLNLASVDPSRRDDVHVCELCGAWFETRKGLSSHARAHLRTFGIESVEAKGAPIDTLHKFMVSKGLKSETATVKEEDSSPAISAKRPASSSPSLKTASKDSASSSPVSVKRFKLSSSSEDTLQESLFKDDESASKSDSESARDIVCEFCGELFTRNQSLSSHARSHLRQLGITEWSVQGSPMATLREVMAQRGVTSILKLPSSALSHTASPRSPLKIPPHPASSLKVPSPLKTHSAPPTAPASSIPQKARKGSRLVNKPKDEPVEVDVSDVIAAPVPSRSDTPLFPPKGEFSTGSTHLTMKEMEVNQPVDCTYCHETFDSRKALSCHARAHLRQLGVRWPAQASPIDTLHELMEREGVARTSDDKPEQLSPARRQSPSPVTFTPPPPAETLGKAGKASSSSEGCDATCELCGFDFENRKALASHARAHLRQQGVEWRISGSPIETLSAWMQREPGKVAELHKRYMMGDLPQVRRRSTASPCYSSDSEATPGGSQRNSSSFRSSLGLVHGSRGSGQGAGASSRSSGSKGDKSSQGPPGGHSEHNSRPLRGGDRRSAKSITDNKAHEDKTSKPSRSGNIPSLVPRPPETPLVKQIGKVYSLKCRFCDREFRGPLSVQEDWVRHLQEHILNLKRDPPTTPGSAPAPASPLPQASPPLLLAPQPV
ncbi:hypothetical protein ACEWY4_018128 [Coilia grayii]|uniref:C2H2-type domain-containing protein n=1 Tax=Coilia grayii TaxID=363190 RepID=A0ABD1JJY9_9TELE